MQHEVLFESTARAIADAPEKVKIRHSGKAQPVRDAVGIPVSKVAKLGINSRETIPVPHQGAGMVSTLPSVPSTQRVLIKILDRPPKSPLK